MAASSASISGVLADCLRRGVIAFWRRSLLDSLNVYIKSLRLQHMAPKLIQAMPGMSKPVTEAEVERFLESKLNLQLATLDNEGYPNVTPVMFYYDKDSGKMYVNADKRSRKVQNIRRNPDKVYYSIDDENLSYEGVKGRARATIIEDTQKNISILEKINLKYLGTYQKRNIRDN
jgi:general stress protein 26